MQIDAALFDGDGSILAGSAPPHPTEGQRAQKIGYPYRYAQPPQSSAELWTGALRTLGHNDSGAMAGECESFKSHRGGVASPQDYCAQLGSTSPSNCTQLGPLTLPEARCALLTECTLDAGMIPGVLEGGGASR